MILIENCMPILMRQIAVFLFSKLIELLQLKLGTLKFELNNFAPKRVWSSGVVVYSRLSNSKIWLRADTLKLLVPTPLRYSLFSLQDSFLLFHPPPLPPPSSGIFEYLLQSVVNFMLATKEVGNLKGN